MDWQQREVCTADHVARPFASSRRFDACLCAGLAIGRTLGKAALHFEAQRWKLAMSRMRL